MRIYKKNGDLHILDENTQMQVAYYGKGLEIPDIGFEKKKKLEEELKKELESNAKELHILKNTKPGLFANKKTKNKYAEKVLDLRNKREAIKAGLCNIDRYKRRYHSSYVSDFAETYFYSRIGFYFPLEGVHINFSYSELEPESLEELLQNFFYMTTDDALNDIREKNRAIVYEDGSRVWTDEEIENFLQ